MVIFQMNSNDTTVFGREYCSTIPPLHITVTRTIQGVPEGIEILPQKRDEFKVFTSSLPSNLLHATSNTASDSFQ
jgi:hypothetical protein